MGIESTVANQVDCLATRQQQLQSTATAAVELATARGKGSSTELHGLLLAFIKKCKNRDTASGNMGKATGGQELAIIANPCLKKNQTQVRMQPMAGPTTKTAARQSRSRKAAKKKVEKAKAKNRVSGF